MEEIEEFDYELWREEYLKHKREYKYCVYEHVCPNGKKYIGYCINPNKRWLNGKGYDANLLFKIDIAFYGWDNIQHNIIADNLEYDDALDLEGKLIFKLKTLYKEYGYNINPNCINDNILLKESQTKRYMNNLLFEVVENELLTRNKDYLKYNKAELELLYSQIYEHRKNKELDYLYNPDKK